MRKIIAVCAAVLAGEVRADDVRYEYNGRSELVRVSCGDETLFGYEYDLAGNLRWASIGSSTNVYETNGLNQYTRVAASNGQVCHLAYDEDGNLIEDGGEPHDIGYFKLDGNGGTGQDALFYANKHVEKKGRHDDCVMREAVKNVQPKPYRLAGSNGMQYNCQDYADDLRKEYFRLLADSSGVCRISCGAQGQARTLEKSL